jgi:hypothetical protein
MRLSPEHRRQLLDDGYVKFPNLVPPDVLRRAVRAINASIGKGMNASDMTTFSAQSFCPEILGTPVISDLFNASPARDLAEDAVGPGRVRPVDAGQVALRFPRDLSVARPPTFGPHIDGMHTPTNGVPKGTISNFTALLGVLLSDLPDEFAGNFTVWPGSHLRHADYFRAHGPRSLIDGMPKVDVGLAKQITGKAGDVVLAHYLLGHGVAPNLSPHVRYACFFRLYAVDHERTRWESMCDPWLQWHGMRGGAEPSVGT